MPSLSASSHPNSLSTTLPVAEGHPSGSRWLSDARPTSRSTTIVKLSPCTQSTTGHETLLRGRVGGKSHRSMRCPCRRAGVVQPRLLPAGTLVLTDRGYRPIEQIEIGELVLTHRGRWQHVTDMMTSRKPTRVIRTHGHPDFGFPMSTLSTLALERLGQSSGFERKR